MNHIYVRLLKSTVHICFIVVLLATPDPAMFDRILIEQDLPMLHVSHPHLDIHKLQSTLARRLAIRPRNDMETLQIRDSYRPVLRMQYYQHTVP